MGNDQAILNFQWNNESEKSIAIRDWCEKERLSKMFEVVKGTGAEFGKDGESFFYISGELPEPDCIVGFGDTPQKALENFYDAFVNGTTPQEDR